MLGLVLSTAALADELRLVTGDDYAPFTGKTLPGGGLMTQVVQAALAEEGMTAALDWQPWNRGYLKTLRGDYDATYPYVPSVQREGDFLYSAPLFAAEQHIFSRASDAIEVSDLPHLAGRRLCYPLGWQPPGAIQALLDQGVLSRHSPQGLHECARLLLLQRDDLFIADRNLGESALRSTGAARQLFHVSSSVFGNSTLHFIVSRSHPRATELIERFNRGLVSLRASGTYQGLLDAYLRQAADQAGASLRPAAP